MKPPITKFGDRIHFCFIINSKASDQQKIIRASQSLNQIAEKMGCNQSADSDVEAKKNNRHLDEEIDRQAKDEAEKIKLLLLGAGESGKSTVFKQMKVIYGEKYTDAEKKQAIPTIHSNVVQAMKTLCEQAVLFNLVSEVKATEEFQMIRGMDENDPITVDYGTAIGKLWLDPGIKLVWDRRSEFQLIESVQYYFNKIDTIKMVDYMPDKDDILNSRVRTSGIVTERYIIDGTTFEIYDGMYLSGLYI